MSPLTRRLARSLAGDSRVRHVLRDLYRGLETCRHAAVQRVPSLLRPRPRNLTVAITARCNLRCHGCRYGRDFMPGRQLPAPVVLEMLEDAAWAGVDSVRFYGGEPLLHPDLPRMVERSIGLGLDPYVTTNATLLERRIADLHAAGLRFLTIGFYGVGDAYDAYVGRRGGFQRVERAIAHVREVYGDAVGLRLNWLLMRPTCNPESLESVLAFARRYRVAIQVDLIHYSLPYFTEGPQQELQFRPEDRPAIERVVAGLIDAKRSSPALVEHSLVGLRSIPDWLLLRERMRVPCDKYDMLWVGADGTVQMCYVTFGLGNLHDRRLRDMLFDRAHREAARAALRLECGNCHCGYDSRTQKFGPSRRRYEVGPDQEAPAVSA